MARKYWYPLDYDNGLCSKAQVGTERDLSEPAPDQPVVWPADETPVVDDQLPQEEVPAAQPKRKGK